MTRPIVMIVDDELPWARLAVWLFSGKGARCLQCGTLSQAQIVLGRETVDLFMINADLVANWRDFPVSHLNRHINRGIVLSNTHSLFVALEAFRCGMDYRDKPFGEEGIAALADDLLRLLDSNEYRRKVQLLPAEKPIRVLVVEDRPEWQRIVSASVGDLPNLAEVKTVDNYDDAINALKEDDIRIVITDIRLEDSNPNSIEGMVLLKQIHQSRAGIAVIVNSGFVTVDLAREAMLRYGVYDLLTKGSEPGSFEVEHLRQIVSRAAQQIVHPQDTIAG